MATHSLRLVKSFPIPYPFAPVEEEGDTEEEQLGAVMAAARRGLNPYHWANQKLSSNLKGLLFAIPIDFRPPCESTCSVNCPATKVRLTKVVDAIC